MKFKKYLQVSQMFFINKMIYVFQLFALKINTILIYR